MTVLAKTLKYNTHLTCRAVDPSRLFRAVSRRNYFLIKLKQPYQYAEGSEHLHGREVIKAAW